MEIEISRSGFRFREFSAIVSRSDAADSFVHCLEITKSQGHATFLPVHIHGISESLSGLAMLLYDTTKCYTVMKEREREGGKEQVPYASGM